MLHAAISADEGLRVLDVNNKITKLQGNIHIGWKSVDLLLTCYGRLIVVPVDVTAVVPGTSNSPCRCFRLNSKYRL